MYQHESIDLGKNLKSIGESAFTDCYTLEKITLPNSITTIGLDAFYKTAWYENQQDGVVYLGNILYAYKGNMSEGTTIDIKEGTCLITARAFNGRNELKEVKCPGSMTYIDDYAFRNCKGQQKINLPNNIRRIGNYAFFNCQQLENITFPDSLRSIGDYALHSCLQLKSIKFPDKLETLGENVLQNCQGITEVELGKGLKSTGIYTFFGCTNISEIVIPDNITHIADFTFSYCSNLKSLTIGRNVKTIGSYIMQNCSSMETVYMMCETPPTVGGAIFAGSAKYENKILYVPAGTMDAYKEHKTWGKFEDIREYDVTNISNTEKETPEIGITSDGIVLSNAEGAAVSVYNVVGVVVEKIGNYAGETMMLDKGVYIIRIGDKTMKVRI